ncbi:hypothetical protein [Mastigocoleus sp. MO_188.B34]|uniref:hypothetical protein n=1 Tax=Mastigocoleus sp. MO_188.B34 TaxID=3036635 RepID=UPI002610491E|nr:hypothetical protein [Mastigocoleus sp. MO_188.B34]MDJ0693979.1 hypothetical protein [Mastigocoleus sp. MO_188.B34]
MLETISHSSSRSSSLSPSQSSSRSSKLSNFVTTLIATTLLSVSFLSVNPLQTNNSLTESFTSQSFDGDVSQIVAQTNSGNPNSLGNLSRILTIGLVGAGAAGLIWRINKGNKSLKTNINSSNYGSWIDRASPPLRKRLLKLLYNDRRTANRLIAGANVTNPGRSVNWLTEKVIYELERDRR